MIRIKRLNESLVPKLKRQTELTQRIESILSPILGPENFTVQVNVDMDFTQSSQTKKTLNPELSVITREKKFETQQSDGIQNGGVAGALSNQPPAAAVIPEITTDNSQNQDNSSIVNSRLELDRSFDVDTTISYTQKQVGLINRLTVSVGVNFIEDPNNAGSRIAMTQSKLDKINRLVQGVIGYDANRGDQIMVDSFDFIQAEEPPEIAAADFFEEPLFQALWKPVVALFGILLLIFVVLKPVMNKLATAPPPIPLTEGFPMLSDSSREDESAETEFHAPGEMGQITRAKALVGNDPKQVAALVQNWVTADE